MRDLENWISMVAIGCNSAALYTPARTICTVGESKIIFDMYFT